MLVGFGDRTMVCYRLSFLSGIETALPFFIRGMSRMMMTNKHGMPPTLKGLSSRRLRNTGSASREVIRDLRRIPPSHEM